MPLLPPKPRASKPFKFPTPGLHNIFAAPPGRCIVGGDLSQLEARIVALLARDQPMLACFADPKQDLHALNAQGLFACSEPQWSALPQTTRDTLRDNAKTFLYGGLLYGGSPQTIHEQIIKKTPTTTLHMVDTAIKAWMAAHPAVATWQAQQVINARRDGYVEVPIMGTRHMFYGVIEPTICLNFPVQGFGARLMKEIIKRVDAAIDWVTTGIIMQIHDALYLETTLAQAPDIWELLKTEMTRPVELDGATLTLGADVGIGLHWGAMTKCKTRDAAQAFVVKSLYGQSA